MSEARKAIGALVQVDGRPQGEVEAVIADPGKGEVITIADSGLDTGEGSTHPEFHGTKIQAQVWVDTRRGHNARAGRTDYDDPNGHGTHVAGLALGKTQGVAPEATLIVQAIADKAYEYGQYDDMTDMLDKVRQKGAVVTQGQRDKSYIANHSWGTGTTRWCRYTNLAKSLDDYTFRVQDLTVVSTAGNRADEWENTDPVTDLNEYYDEALMVGDPYATELVRGSSIAPPGWAKNCITVGAVQRVGQRYEVLRWSGRGDGTRVKPDVVAPGLDLLSARSSLRADAAERRDANGTLDGGGMYRLESGTSQAAPLVSGCAALVRQFLRENAKALEKEHRYIGAGLGKPNAALIKAALICGAEPLPGYRLGDVHQGWGMVNVARVIRESGDTRMLFLDGVINEPEASFTLSFAYEGGPLKLVLAWLDPGATVDASSRDALVNHLHLQARLPDGVFVGNRFVDRDDIAASELFREDDVPDVTELDHCNNVQVITFSRLGKMSKRCTAAITASSLQQSQPFALAVLGRVSDLRVH